MNHSAGVRSALEFFATAHLFREHSLESVNLCCWNDVVGKVPVRSCRASSEDLRTPVLGQAVNQSAELQSALEFFATAHSFRERTLESFN